MILRRCQQSRHRCHDRFAAHHVGCRRDAQSSVFVPGADNGSRGRHCKLSAHALTACIFELIWQTQKGSEHDHTTHYRERQH
jgi:hypothetical protein